MRWAALACLASACWSSSPAAPSNQARPAQERFVVTLERTDTCHGPCPAYTVTIDGDDVTFRGKTEDHRGRADRQKLARVKEAVRRLRFFELDDGGRLPVGPTVRRDGAVRTYDFQGEVFCSGMSHAIVTVTRGGVTKRITINHCSEKPITELEALIDEAAGTHRWISPDP